jgi:CRISPR type III-B/RAMP module-associated protein Cmr5
MKARSQEYAAAVYKKVMGIDGKDWPDYQGFCYRFPFILRENGLVAVLGFLASKGKTEKNHDNAALQLLKHYAFLFHRFELISQDDVKFLQDESRKADLMQYRRMTQHALQLAEWFKRYAEGRGDK